MDFPSRRFMAIASGCAAALVALAYGLNGTLFEADPAALGLALAMVLSYGLAAAVAFSGARRVGLSGYFGKAFATMAAGMAGMTLGFLVEDYYKYVLLAETPYPSVADIFFFLYTPLVVLGLLMFLRVYSLQVTRRLVAECALLALLAVAGTFYVMGATVLPGDLALTNLFSLLASGNPLPWDQLTAEALSALYLLTDAIYIATALVVLRVSRGRLSPGLGFFTVGILLVTAADFVYSFKVETGTYFEGDASDILFFLGGLVQAAAVGFLVRPFALKVRQGLRTPANADA